MTPEILDEALSAENAYAYHFLKEEYRQDPEILRRVLLTYKPNLPSYLPKRSSMSK